MASMSCARTSPPMSNTLVAQECYKLRAKYPEHHLRQFGV